MKVNVDPHDDPPYPELCHSWTHPSRLAAIATLSGMRPAPPERCRVLELGCASGGNLVPMAYGLPGSTFVGVDISAPPRSTRPGRSPSASPWRTSGSNSST